MVNSIDEAVALVAELLSLPELSQFQPDPVASEAELAAAIERHDMPALYRNLMDAFSYQGIADGRARNYIAAHGNAEWLQVEATLAAKPSCPKLVGFAAFRGCGYQKVQASCAHPDLLVGCPVPPLPLRKGRLNEQAFSAFLFLRDHAGGDLVDFIDGTLAIAAVSTNPITIGREALIAALASIVGVSRKLASMTLASLLIAGAKRPGWEDVGRSMVAIDSLVHNFLHRTGILAAYGAEHLYGARCFGAVGCEVVIRDLTERLHASTDGDDRERLCPRYVQHAIWRYCASDELAVCNGNNIPAATACELDWCPLWDRCSRLPLRAPPSAEEVP